MGEDRGVHDRSCGEPEAVLAYGLVTGTMRMECLVSTILAEVRGAALQEGLGPTPKPELLGTFDPLVELLNEYAKLISRTVFRGESNYGFVSDRCRMAHGAGVDLLVSGTRPLNAGSVAPGKRGLSPTVLGGNSGVRYE
jgi:hypothetical protein